MSVTLNFKYKDSSILKNGQTAGFVNGCNSLPAMKNGNKGKSGANLYFTEYYIGNAYDNKICLDNIENNLLTNGSGMKLEGRTYVEGDLFLNPLNEMYKLVKADEGSSLKFDLKYIGVIKLNRNQQEYSDDNIKMFIDNISFEDIEYVTERCIGTVNRGYDSKMSDFHVLIDFIISTDSDYDSVNISDVFYRDYNDIDCSSGALYYYDWNKRYFYTVISKYRAINNVKHVLAIGLASPAKVGSGDIFNLSTDASIHYSSFSADVPKVTNVKLKYTSTPSSTLLSTISYEDISVGMTFYFTSTTSTTTLNVPVVKKETDDNEQYIIVQLYNYDTSNWLFTQFTDANTSQRKMKLVGNDSSYFYYKSVTTRTDVITYPLYGLYYIPPMYDVTHKMLYDFDNGKPYTGPTYDETYKGMFGIKFKPIIKFLDDVPNKSRYKFYMRIYLKNKKHFQDACFSLDGSVSDVFDVSTLNEDPILKEPVNPSINTNESQFYKYVEFPLIDNDSSTEYYPTFISDYVADKLHPSGNNISINFVANPNGAGVAGNFVTHQQYQYDNTYYAWYRFKHDTDASHNYEIDKRNHHADDRLFKGMFYDLQHKNYEDTHAMIQYYKRTINACDAAYDESASPKYSYVYSDSSTMMINYRGGDSAYFSGMTLATLPSSLEDLIGSEYIQYFGADEKSTFNQYVSMNKLINIHSKEIVPNQVDVAPVVEYLTKEAVAREIHKFIFSPENIYEVICVDVSTGHSFIVNKKDSLNIPPVKH